MSSWFVRAGLTVTLFVFSIMGFLEMTGERGLVPTNDDGSAVSCDPLTVGSPDGGVRFVGSICDNGRYYASTARGGTDWSRELSEDEFAKRNFIAENLVDGWSTDIDVNSPSMQEFLVEHGFGQAG